MKGLWGGLILHPNHRAGRGDGQSASRISLRSIVGLVVGLVLVTAGLVGTGAAINPALAGNGGDTKTISAKALSDHKCDNTEWHFVATQVDTEADAPASIHVTWANGDSQDVSLSKFTGGVAHYSTTANLDSTVTSATANIYIGWSGQFNLSHGPCGENPPPPTTVTPQPPSATPPSCDHPNQTVTPPNQEGVVWNPSGPTLLHPGESVLYTATPAEGYAFPDGVTHEWEFTDTFDTSTCETPPTEVTPAAPTHTKPSCDNASEVVSPSNQDGVIWSPSGSTTLQPGDSVTYTATPAEGYAFPDGAQTSWTFKNEFDTSTCQQPPTQVTPAAPTATPPSCDHPNQTVTPSNQEGVVWNPSGPTVLKPGDSVLYTASPAEGYVFPEGATHEWEFTDTFDTSTCEQPPTEVTPASPTATTPDCKTPTETVTPTLADGVVWSPAGPTVLTPGDSVTYTATPAEGYAFPDGAQTSWTFTNTFDTSMCHQPPPIHQGKLLTVKKACGQFTLRNHNGFRVEVVLNHDGKVFVPAHGERTVKTSRHHVHFSATGQSSNGHVVLSQTGNVTVPQNCGRHHHGHKPPKTPTQLPDTGYTKPATVVAASGGQQNTRGLLELVFGGLLALGMSVRIANQLVLRRRRVGDR